VSDYVEFEPWLTSPAAVEETPNAEVRMPNRGPTVVRDAARLTSSLNPSITALFDATGRRTSAAKPGVYVAMPDTGRLVRRVVRVR
jgi:hypothetical protein